MKAETEPWSMPLPELEEGVELKPNELPKHAELNLANLPSTHGPQSEWRQKGTVLSCITCPDDHGLYLEPRQMYSGKKDEKGNPIIVNRW